MDDYLIYGDFHKLKQVLRNIISNAIKFNQPNTGVIAVNIVLYHTDSYQEDISNYDSNNPNNNIVNSNNLSNKVLFNRLKISISDNGPGISKDNQNKMFKSVIQFNPGLLQDGGGSGLGLFSKYKYYIHKYY